MKVRAINLIKYKGQYHIPGTVIDIPEREIAESLVESKSATMVGAAANSLTPSQLLQEVPGVNAKVATLLLDNGIDTVDRLSGEEIADLEKLGIAKATAKKIYQSFD